MLLIQNPLTTAETYLCCLQYREPNNYTRVPNIINHLTYDEIDPKTKKITTKRLSVYAKELYRVLKQIGGEDRPIWMNAENLAELCNMSEGQVSKCKKELMQKFHQLDNNPLIIITERKKNTSEGNKKINGTIYHQIMILDIWGYSKGHYFLKSIEKSASSQYDPAYPASSQYDPASERASSQYDPINININNIPMLKEQHPTADADSSSSCSSSSDDPIPDDAYDVYVSKYKNEKMFASPDHKRVYDWLIKEGCDEKSARSLAKFDPEDMKKGSLFLKNQLQKNNKKGKKISNRWGYLRRILENRYWENNE